MKTLYYNIKPTLQNPNRKEIIEPCFIAFNFYFIFIEAFNLFGNMRM
jgi:hypothetical protein